MRHLKLIFSLAIIVCTLSIAVTGLVKAQAFKSDSKGTISIQRLNNESQFLAANKINIAGTVNGDVFCVGRTVNISGIVNGDVFLRRPNYKYFRPSFWQCQASRTEDCV